MNPLANRYSETMAWLVLIVLLLLMLPLFLRMPLWVDTTVYDLAARNVLRGGVPYRDIFDTNLPGMVWAHMGIRSLLGWSSEALRLADILIVFATFALLVGPLQGPKTPRAARIWMFAALSAAYLSTSEFCHCQRDTWMLLPAVLAVCLRARQLDRLTNVSRRPGQVLLWAVLEGFCWSAAFWIKPFVIIPALFVWILSAWFAVHSGRSLTRSLVLDGSGVIAGGLLSGAIGTIWLIHSGGWPFFWDIMLSWNTQYIAPWFWVLERLRCLLFRQLPWGLLHLAAVPLAFAVLWRPMRAAVSLEKSSWQTALLATFYLGWIVQILLLQHAWDYVLTPAMLLAVAVVVGQLRRRALSRSVVVLLVVFLGLAASRHPGLRRNRLVLWGSCWESGDRAQLLDQLALTHEEVIGPTWRDLARVGKWLRQRNLQDGQVTCFGNSTCPLYLDLDLRPSVRYVHLTMTIGTFPLHRKMIRKELSESRQRYIVSDLRYFRLDPSGTEEPSDTPYLSIKFPPDYREVFPWSEPVVFRAGRYLIHEAQRPVGRLTPSP